jgi:hypothetical protein
MPSNSLFFQQLCECCERVVGSIGNLERRRVNLPSVLQAYLAGTGLPEKQKKYTFEYSWIPHGVEFLYFSMSKRVSHDPVRCAIFASRPLNSLKHRKSDLRVAFFSSAISLLACPPANWPFIA